jgi:hypothetical protein
MSMVNQTDHDVKSSANVYLAGHHRLCISRVTGATVAGEYLATAQATASAA